MRLNRYTVATGALLALFVALPVTRTTAQDAVWRFERSIELAAENSWIWLGKSASIWFEGATTDASQTNLVVVDPTADRTLTLPDTTGHLIAAEDGVTVSGMRAGSVALDGSNPTSVTTGLSVIVACDIELMRSATPDDDPIGFTIDTHATAGRLDIYAYKNTSGTDPTWTASTEGGLIRWFCVGTP